MDEYGYNLPRGTRVYFWHANQYPVSHILKDTYSKPFLSPDSYVYIFKGGDGLWATKIIRKYWFRKPQFHPHATLFEIMQNYTSSG
jgi:hypothetical protein